MPNEHWRNAAPVLQAAIDNDALSPVPRSNAASALWVVVKDKVQAIALTAKAAQSSGEPEAAIALKKIRNEMAGHCNSNEAQRCKAAFNPN